MKVNGQLEGAQFEQKAGAPTPTPTGRIYADITAPLAAVPYFFDGTSWRQMAFSSSNAFVAQNSGKQITVDWSTGINQRVILTDNAVISFSNPTEGQTYTLVVSQIATGVVPFAYTLDMKDQDVSQVQNKNFQPMQLLPIRSSRTHQWVYKAGVRAAYTSMPGNNGVVAGIQIPGSVPFGCDVTWDGNFLTMGLTSTPFNYAYTISPTLPGQANGLGIAQGAATASVALSLATRTSPNGQWVAACGNTTPFLQVASASNLGRAITYFTNPATLPTGGVQQIDWHPSSQYIMGVGAVSPFVYIYPVGNGVFGTKLADPGTLPTGACYSAAFSPHGDYLALASNVSPFIHVYAFNYSAGTFGAKSANPGTLPAAGPSALGGVRYIAWRPQGDWIAMAMSASPYLYVVPFNRTTGVFGTPITLGASAIPPGVGRAVRFSPCGSFLLLGSDASPFLVVYDFTNFTLTVAPYTYDVGGPASSVYDISFHPSGEYFFTQCVTTPYLYQMQMPNVIKNYIKVI